MEGPAAAGILRPKPVAEARGAAGNQGLEEIGARTPFQRRDPVAVAILDHKRFRMGHEGPDDEAIRRFMRPQKSEGITVARGNEGFDIRYACPPTRHRNSLYALPIQPV